jgi:hypothetical protein
MKTTCNIGLTLVLVLSLALVLGACGGTSSAPGIALPTRTGVLAELDGLTAPEGVPSDLFGALKAELERQLAEQGRIGPGGKLASVPPTGEDNRVNSIGYREEGGNYILTWNYRLLGDYDQNGRVNIADITPIAVNFGRTVAEYPGAEPVDGSGNGKVGIEDITPIAVYFGVTVESYDIEGSDAADGTYTNVGNILFGDAQDAVGWRLFEFDLGPAPTYEWYRVVPRDSGGTPGVESLPVHIVPGGGGGLVIFLVSAAESGAGLVEDPYVLLRGTTYEIGVEDENGNPFELPIVLTLYPPFVDVDLTDTAPYTITPTSDPDAMIGDIYVYATAEGDLVSNPLYFRVPSVLP